MRKRDGERGQSLVEFALVLPVLALFLLGIVDFGRIYSAHLTASEAARDAARYASIGESNATIGQVIQDDTASLSGGASWTINPDTTRTSGDTVTVNVSTSVAIFDPLLMAFLGTNFPVNSSVTMRVE